MPADSPIQCRDRALVAFTLLTGARDRAIAWMKLKHLNLAAGCVEQDAREVQTKFSKTFTTYFFPVGGEIGRSWTSGRASAGETALGDDDPLFPATRVEPGHLSTSRRWASSGPLEHAAAIRAVFRRAFESAGLPYCNPHSVRSTLVRLSTRSAGRRRTSRRGTRISNHENVLTTLTSYGQVGNHRQAEILRNLSDSQTLSSSDLSLAMELIRKLKGNGRP